MHISFECHQFKLPPQYCKVEGITSQFKERTYKEKKNPKEMYLKIVDSFLEFSSCPLQQYSELTEEFVISIDNISSSQVKENKERKFVLGLVEKGKMTAIRFDSNDDCKGVNKKIDEYREKSNKIMQIGKQKNYLKLQQNLKKVRRILFFEKQQKRWLYDEISKRIANVQMKNEYDTKQLLLEALFEDEPEMIQAKIQEKIQSYDIKYATANIERMHNKEEILSQNNKRALVKDIIEEGYSKKKQLQGLIPEEDIIPIETIKEKQRKLQEELFLHSSGNYHSYEENREMQIEMIDMDIEEKTIIRKEKKKMIANKLKIPQKEYPLFQERQIQFVDQQRPGMKNKQDKKEREREEFQLTKKIVQTIKLFYKFCKMKFDDGLESVDIYIDEIRKILAEFQKKVYEIVHLRQFIKRAKQNYLQRIKH